MKSILQIKNFLMLIFVISGFTILYPMDPFKRRSLERPLSSKIDLDRLRKSAEAARKKAAEAVKKEETEAVKKEEKGKEIEGPSTSGGLSIDHEKELDEQINRVKEALTKTQNLGKARRIRDVQKLGILLDPDEEEYFFEKLKEIAPTFSDTQLKTFYRSSEEEEEAPVEEIVTKPVRPIKATQPAISTSAPKRQVEFLATEEKERSPAEEVVTEPLRPIKAVQPAVSTSAPKRQVEPLASVKAALEKKREAQVAQRRLTESEAQSLRDLDASAIVSAIKAIKNDVSLTAAIAQFDQLADVEKDKVWDLIKDYSDTNKFYTTVKNYILSYYTKKLTSQDSIGKFLNDKLELSSMPQSLRTKLAQELIFIPSLVLANQNAQGPLRFNNISDLNVQVPTGASSFKPLAISRDGKWLVSNYTKTIQSGFFGQQSKDVSYIAVFTLTNNKRYEQVSSKKLAEIEGTPLRIAFSNNSQQLAIAYRNESGEDESEEELYSLQIIRLQDPYRANTFAVNTTTSERVRNLKDLKELVINNTGTTIFLRKEETPGLATLAVIKVNYASPKRPFFEDIAYNLKIDELIYDDQNKQLLAWEYPLTGKSIITKWKSEETNTYIKLLKLKGGFTLEEKVRPILVTNNIIFAHPQRGDIQNKLILQLISETTGKIINTFETRAFGRGDIKLFKLFELNIDPGNKQLILHRVLQDEQKIAVEQRTIELFSMNGLTLEKALLLYAIEKHALSQKDPEKRLNICSVSALQTFDKLPEEYETTTLEEYVSKCSIQEAYARQTAAVGGEYARRGIEVGGEYARSGAEAAAEYARTGADIAARYTRSGVEAAKKGFGAWWSGFLKRRTEEKEQEVGERERALQRYREEY